ncbi:MAG: type 1 glutamine amidotransferase [Betaproteobacteria bacterium]|nr:type 1 glutamine amidotransferase [Betaproteobacteria bacterium]
MKPIAIFRHSPTEGPGYFATYLDSRDLPWQLVALDRGEAVPSRTEDFSGLVFMGGPMSVNDDLAWIAPELELIRKAVAADVPVLGHCLGGQLMSKALGGSVGRNPIKEIGWGEIEVADNPEARAWFGSDLKRFESFHWHGETFTIPPGGVRIMGNRNCENQGFAIGRSIGMQCHVEMTEALIESWCKSGADEIATARSSAVQTEDEMRRGMGQKLVALRAVATRLYDHWVEGLSKT